MKKRGKIRNFFYLFKDNKPALVAFLMLCFLLFIALFADLIATDQPLYASYKNKRYFPAFTSILNPTKLDSVIDPATGIMEVLQFDLIDWKILETNSIVFAPIPYSPGKPDKLNRDFSSPFDLQKMKLKDGAIVESSFRFRHHLGTDLVGNDLFSTLIHGTRLALKVGLISILIASIIGVFLGAIAGYFGDHGLKTSRASYYLMLLGLFPGLFYAFIFRSAIISLSFEEGFFQASFQICLSFLIFFAFIFVFNKLGRLFHWIKFLKVNVSIPVDFLVSRSIEIMNSLPRILIIVTLAAIFKDKSLGLVMAIIGFTSWTGIARFTRAEMLRQSKLEYVEAAKALGIPNLKVIFKHALPNAFAPVMIEIAFSIAAAILLESGLSFLGIGVPDDVATWGSVLSTGRQHFDAWWLVVFPGLAIFVTVTSFNLLGDWFRDLLNPKSS